MAAIAKQTFHLTGAKLPLNPKAVLQSYYKRLLVVLQKMPETAAYRRHTESIVKQRSSIINSTDDMNVIKEKIACGEIVDILLQAQNELTLAETMLLSRPWEKLVAPIPKNQWKWPIA